MAQLSHGLTFFRFVAITISAPFWDECAVAVRLVVADATLAHGRSISTTPHQGQDGCRSIIAGCRRSLYVVVLLRLRLGSGQVLGFPAVDLRPVELALWDDDSGISEDVGPAVPGVGVSGVADGLPGVVILLTMLPLFRPPFPYDAGAVLVRKSHFVDDPFLGVFPEGDSEDGESDFADQQGLTCRIQPGVAVFIERLPQVGLGLREDVDGLPRREGLATGFGQIVPRRDPEGIATAVFPDGVAVYTEFRLGRDWFSLQVVVGGREANGAAFHTIHPVFAGDANSAHERVSQTL